jgi:carboxypeptidase PM20D1
MPRIVAACAALLMTVSSTVFASPAERLGESIRFRTISYQTSEQVDYAEFDRLNDYLRTTFPLVFEQLLVETVNDYSLLIRWPGSDESLQPILFTAHTDVVPVEPATKADWSYPPFDGVVADGRIYGRGTLDDKVGVMSLLEAAEQLLAEGFVPRRGIVLAFGHDEEISGKQGAVSLAARMTELGLHFSWMVDEGGWLLSESPLLPDKVMAMVSVAEKPYMTLTLVATGEGGHSSNPPIISTIGRLSSALARIEDNPFEPRLVAPMVAMLEALAPHVGQPERFIFSNLWLTGGLVASNMAEQRMTQPFVRTTTALTVFNGGVKENVVPQRAEAKVNLRLLPGDTPEMVLETITALVDDPQIEISYFVWGAETPVSDHTAEGFKIISEVVSAVYPEAVVTPAMQVGITDSRHYTQVSDNQYRFHGMLITTDQTRSFHGTDEYIEVDSYTKAIEIARQMMHLGAR